MKAIVAAFSVILAAGAAHAQSSVFGPQTFHGLVDVRLAAAGGEKSWLDDGAGKTDAMDGLSLSEVALEWRPRFNFNLGAVVTAELQPKISDKVDLGEAYLRFTAPPSPLGRLTGRAGLFFPPVSLENEGVAWTHPDMLTASAANSWIGEEVKVLGVEGTLERQLGDHQISATAAVFGWNDTSATLLTFRGWALGSVKAPTRHAFELPALSAFMSSIQGDETYPYRELDNRAGYYGRIEWRPPAPVVFDAFYYDNRGDRTAVDGERQWSWKTRFANLGMTAELGDKTRILAQAMRGETYMGYRYQGQTWVDLEFSTAYVEARRAFGDDALTGRLDWFSVDDRSLKAIDNNDEDGWAATAAWRQHLTTHADLLFEALYVDSKRPSRIYAGEPPKQDQTILQSALRLSF